MRRLLGLGLLVAGLLAAQTGNTYFVIVGGLGGEADYEQRFNAYVSDLDKLCRTLAGHASRVTALSGKSATREAVQAALGKLASTTTSADTVAVFLIGHGTYDGAVYKFNVAGPDVTQEDLKNWLDRIKAGRQLLMVATSSSGVLAEQLQRDNRVVVTATRSGTERNAVIFSRYWVEALRDPAADTDKNETISALEAFRYADEKVKRFFTEQKRLATEHARLEGKIAGTFVLARMGQAAQAAQDPAKRKLLTERESLEQQIDALKLRKSALPTDQYRKELERLLLELAKIQDTIEGGGTVQP